MKSQSPATRSQGMGGRLAAILAAVLLPAAMAAAETESPTSSGAVAVLDTPIFRIPQTRTPPKIDGILGEKEWEDASALSGFWYDWYQSHFYFMAPIQTQLQVYAAFDRENLYFAYSSPVHPKDSWLRALGRFPDVVAHPQYGVLWDDHVELEIRPLEDNVKAFQLGLFKWIANPIGTMTDQLWSLQLGEGFRYQSKAKVASNVTGDRWTIEFAIPLESLRFGPYAGTDDRDQPLVKLPVPDGTAYRVWFARAIGGNREFFNCFDSHMWNTTKTKMVLDSQAPSFQVNELGPIMDDVIDVQLTVKNHSTRSRTVRIGFFVENAEGTIYSSYRDKQMPDGLLELVPGEVRKLRLKKKFPGVTTEGNTLWFDVRSAGRPARPLLLTRLINFHSMEGGRFGAADGSWISFRYRRIDVIARMRPPRKDFDFWYAYSAYKNRLAAVVDKGIYGAGDEAKTAVEAKLTVLEAGPEERQIASHTVPFRGNHACFLFDMPEKLNSGKYRAVLLLFDRNKRIVGEASPEPFYKGTFPWVQNTKGLNDTVWEPFTPIQVAGDGFETLKHRFSLAPTGLPAQIAIKPDARDLPLEHRKAPGGMPAAALRELGRGPQLRSPLRLEAVVDGRRVQAQVVRPAKLTRQWKSEVQYTSGLKVGPLDVDLDVQYDCDGAMTVKMTYGADKPADVDGLELVAELAGQYDLANSDASADIMVGTDRRECSLPAGEGVVWDSAELEHPPLYYTRFIPWMYVGSGDRGFTWIADSDEHWTIDRDGSTMTLARDKAGDVTWTVRFVNHKAKIQGRRTIEFVLLTHPAKPKPKAFRRIAWLQAGDVQAHMAWPTPKFGSDEEIKAGWRKASGAPRDLPDSARATYAKLDAPWNRYYHLRGDIPAIPATIQNALNGDLFGRMGAVPPTRRVKRIIDNEEQWVDLDVTKGGAEGEWSGGGMCNMGRAWQDLFVWNWERLIRLGRYHGWWWDEMGPVWRSQNLAAGEAYLRDPADVRPNELPWQDTFLTTKQRGMFKRLARAFKDSGVPCRQHLWSNNAATAFESYAWDSKLVEDCSSDHRSSEIDNVLGFPNSLFKLHAHNYTGMIVRLVPPASHRGGPLELTGNISNPGDEKRLDRQLMGRALLNDIGFQPTGAHGRLQHNEQAVRLINALIDFGYFADDGMTEMIPYWRTRPYVQYGETFEPDGEFELNRRDPYAKVYVTVFRRPIRAGGKDGYKAMFVVMNEGEAPIRDRLIINDPVRIFGGPNCMTNTEIVTQHYDHSKIEGLVKNSDWRTAKLLGHGHEFSALMDLEDRGAVKVASSKGRQGEVYGPLHVLRHDYRVVYGYWMPGAEPKGAKK